VGSRGNKPRKPKHSQHLPKVGTAPETQRLERDEAAAVLDNMGLRGAPSWARIAAGVIAVLLVVGAVIGLTTFR
jgi:hypothetical protein